MRFHCPNGLVVPHIFVIEREHWFQKMRFVGSNASFSLMLLFRHAEITVGQGEQ